MTHNLLLAPAPAAVADPATGSTDPGPPEYDFSAQDLPPEVRAALLPKPAAVAPVEDPKLEEDEPGPPPALVTPEQQALIDQAVAPVKSELDTAKSEAAAAAARLKELETQVQTLSAKPFQIIPVDPVFLLGDPAKLAKRERELAQFETWALTHWDGVPETADADGTVTQPAIPAAAIRQAYAARKQEREKIPLARQYLSEDAQYDAAARAEYPELFDPKRPEHAQAQEVLRQVPGIRLVFPNIMTLIGNMIEGEKTMAQRQAARKNGKPGSPAAQPAAAPKVPAAAKPGPAVLPKPVTPKNALDPRKFNELTAKHGEGRALEMMFTQS